MKKLPLFPKFRLLENDPDRPGRKRQREIPHTTEEVRTLLEAREAWAAARILVWELRGLHEKDYDFRSWASGGNDGVPVGAADGHMGLRLGALYEYAREGRKLRGLLLLIDPARKREPWETYYKPTFEGVSAEQASHALFEMIDVLAFLAEPLAANLPFAEVWRSKRELVEQALEHGRLWYQMRRHQGITSHWRLGRGAAVELAKPGEMETATTAHTLFWGGESPKSADAMVSGLHEQTLARQIVDGKEVILVRLDYGNYRDDHLKEAFGELVKWLRRTKEGGGEVPPEPKHDKSGKKATVLTGDLTNLRAMRLVHHYTDINKALDEAQRTGNQGLTVPHLYGYAKAGRRMFKLTFPFEGEPWHHETPRVKKSEAQK